MGILGGWFLAFLSDLDPDVGTVVVVAVAVVDAVV